jgi:hypothetical protein
VVGPDGNRHLSLRNLPPAVAEKVRFANAAPRRLRSDKLPAEARQVFEDLWDGLVADVYDEVAGVSRRKLFSKKVVERVMQRVAVRVQQGERALIVTGVYWPMPGDADWKHVAVGGAGGAASAAAEEIAAFGSAGTGATVAVTAAIVGELFETYVATSGRTQQYRRTGRSPAPDLIVADLAETLGLTRAAGRRAGIGLTKEALGWLDHKIIERASRRFARGLVPVVGVASGAGMAGSGVRKLLKLPLRPASEDEVMRMAHEIVNDPSGYEAAYVEDLTRFELDEDSSPELDA